MSKYIVWYVTPEIIEYDGCLASEYIILEEQHTRYYSFYHMEECMPQIGEKNSREKDYWIKLHEYYDKPEGKYCYP